MFKIRSVIRKSARDLYNQNIFKGIKLRKLDSIIMESVFQFTETENREVKLQLLLTKGLNATEKNIDIRSHSFTLSGA